MTITILALAFLILIGFIAYIGYKTVIKQGPKIPEELSTEKCSICRDRFAKELLVERQIGDYRLLYFCRNCIMGLYADLGMKN